MRFQDLGIDDGYLPRGATNTLTDVAGVRVGHTTLIEGDSIRTGVTAILPHGDDLFHHKVPAAVYTINGFGKATGFEQVRELGCIETPILLTNTLNVGLVADACVQYVLQNHPNTPSVNPIVGECNDGYLNDIQGRYVRYEHVLNAIQTADERPVAEGCVGGGTGTTCYGFKGGIGSASRLAGDGFTVGTLVQTNFGVREELLFAGIPLGRHIPKEPNPRVSAGGSIMMVIATDAPLTPRQLQRLAHRAAFGLGRTGTSCHHGSGDFVIAFSTGYRIQKEPQMINLIADDDLNPLFRAVVECIEESVYNALLQAETMHGKQNRSLPALPHQELIDWLRHYRRLD